MYIWCCLRPNGAWRMEPEGLRNSALPTPSFLPTPLPYLAALSSICLHSCFSQSGPWLTFNSALTDTGRRLSKRGPSNNEMWISWATSGSATDSTHTHQILGSVLFNELWAVWLNTTMSPTSADTVGAADSVSQEELCTRNKKSSILLKVLRILEEALNKTWKWILTRCGEVFSILE